MADGSSDSELLQTYASRGHDPAFSELVKRHIGLVYRSALRQLAGDSHAAEDVTQAVFMLLARKASRLVNHTSLVGWLHTTTRLVARDAIRGTARRRAREQEAVAMDLQENQPNWQHLGAVIDAALADLDERDRTAVLLRYFSGLPFAAIGDQLGVAENAARMRVDRALEKLRVQLRRHGIDSPAVALTAALANEAAGTPLPGELAARISHTVTSAGAATSGTVGGIAALLSVAKLMTLASFVLTATTIGTLAYGLYARHEARQRLSDAEHQLRWSEERAHELARQAAAGEQQLEKRRAAVAKARAEAAAKSAIVAVAEKQPAEWDPRAEGTAFMERHPEVKKALREWFLASARFRYRQLLQELRLAPAQADRFLEVMLGMNTLSAPFGPGGRQLMFVLGDSAATQTFGQELKDLLGNQGMAKLNAYNQTLTARADVTTLASSLALAEMPMSAEQASLLTAAFVAHSRTVSGQPEQVIDWPALMAQANTILSPNQLPAFNALRDAILTRQKHMIVLSPLPTTPTTAHQP